MAQSSSSNLSGFVSAEWQQHLSVPHMPFKPLASSMIAVISAVVLSAMTVTANANSLIHDNSYLQYELPSTIQERCHTRQNCPKIELQYLNSNQDWINEITNARINSVVLDNVMTESATSDNIDKHDVKTALDRFASSQFNDLPEDSVFVYSLTAEPRYLGHIDDYELFEINAYTFTGGAHGMPYSEYLIFDQRTKRHVQLVDILRYGVKTRFRALAYDAYKDWVKTVAEDPERYEKSWPFTLSDDVTLTDKGLDIRYQHYAIGPYAYGMPVLSIPYDKLQGIIKPQFFPKSRSSNYK